VTASTGTGPAGRRGVPAWAPVPAAAPSLRADRRRADHAVRAPRAARRPPSRGLDAVLRVVGVVGEVMITVGVVVLLFLAWQLWWTDVVADRAQAAIVSELQWQAPPDVAVPALQKHTDDPPAEPVPALGEVWATLYVPRFGDHYVRPVAEGVDKETILDKVGVGHYPQTSMPGQIGNFAVAGHRTTFGKPFTHIERLRKGDAVVLRTETTWYVYKVTEHLIVYPDQVGVLSPVPDEGTTVSPAPEDGAGGRYLTMTSCHPRYWALQRYVVHGELEYWAPVSSGVPAELDGVDVSQGKKGS